MQSPNIDAGRFVSVDAGWSLGMNSLRHPWLLPEGQYRAGINVINRGGIVQTRPGYKLQLILPEGNLQGMCHFRANKNYKEEPEQDYLVFSVDGNIYISKFPLTQPLDWEQNRLPNLKFSAEAKMVHFCSAEKTVRTSEEGDLQLLDTYNVLLIQDGITAAGFWDGQEANHLEEKSPKFQTPRGTWMRASGGRLWIARGRNVIASNLLDPLSFTERTEGEGRGDFYFGDEVSGLARLASNTNQQEALVVFTDSQTSALRSGLRNREQWAKTEDFQTILFPSTGCCAGRSVTFQSGLMWWYTQGGLVSSDIATSTNLSSQINFRDNEMASSKQMLYPDLSSICSTSHENFLLISCPVGQSLNAETFVLDYSVVGEASDTRTPCWAGTWTGIRPVEWARALIDSEQRVFAASVDISALPDGSHNHIWEVFSADREDKFFTLQDDKTISEYTQPIFCQLETRLIGQGHDLKLFSHAEINLSELSGTVNVECSYRGTRSVYKRILCKTIHAQTTDETLPEEELSEEDRNRLGDFQRQSRRLRTENSVSSGECSCEDAHNDAVDRSFSLQLQWCGQAAVESLRIFMEPYPEEAYGRAEVDEDKACIVGENGNTLKVSVPAEIPYIETEEKFWTSSAVFSADDQCPSDSLTADISVTASVTYKSRISQSDAELGAHALAEQKANEYLAYLRAESPCSWSSTQVATRDCMFIQDATFWYLPWEDLTRFESRIPGEVIMGKYDPYSEYKTGIYAVNTSTGKISDALSVDDFVMAFEDIGYRDTRRPVLVRRISSNLLVATGQFNQHRGVPCYGISIFNNEGDPIPCNAFIQGLFYGEPWVAGPANVADIWVKNSNTILVSGDISSANGQPCSGVAKITGLDGAVGNPNSVQIIPYSIPGLWGRTVRFAPDIFGKTSPSSDKVFVAGYDGQVYEPGDALWKINLIVDYEGPIDTAVIASVIDTDSGPVNFDGGASGIRPDGDTDWRPSILYCDKDQVILGTRLASQINILRLKTQVVESESVLLRDGNWPPEGVALWKRLSSSTPELGGSVYSIQRLESTSGGTDRMYIAGDFDMYGNPSNPAYQKIPNFARIHPETGEPVYDPSKDLSLEFVFTPWNPTKPYIYNCWQLYREPVSGSLLFCTAGNFLQYNNITGESFSGYPVILRFEGDKEIYFGPLPSNPKYGSATYVSQVSYADAKARALQDAAKVIPPC